MTKSKSGRPRPHTPVHAKPLPDESSDSGLIADKMKDAASFKKKTDDFKVVTPFEHAPGTV